MKDYDILKIANRALWFMLGLLVLLLFIYGGSYAFIKVSMQNDLSSDTISGAYSLTGSLGDSINGIFAPIIGLAAVITTFLAFIVQFQANQDIRRDTKIERFENKFYEMLRLHKENVNELKFDLNHSGRNVFVKIFEEFKFLYSTLLKINDINHLLSKINDLGISNQEKLVKIAYHHMFFGIDFLNSRCNNPMNEQYESISKQFCEMLTQEFKAGNGVIQLKSGFVLGPVSFKYDNNEQTYRSSIDLNEIKLTGHASKLGHTYRHLFQMIKYIVRSKELNWNNKYSYIKMIRAQLSNHEQVMIYYNAIWIDNTTWWADKDKNGNVHRYLLDYGLVKNIPFNLTDQVGPEVVSFFKGKLGNGPHFIDPDEEEVTIEDKLDWLFEWGVKDRLN